MDKIIEVDEVIEKNGCDGKKLFYITALEEKDELIHSKFRLTRAYMPAEHKLLLARVSPMDRVKVVSDHRHGELTVIGEYVDNYSDINNRESVCRCQTKLISDGFDIYCPNEECGLTIAARLERLANTAFAEPDVLRLNEVTGDLGYTVALGEVPTFYRPFSIIQQGLFWGWPGGSLEHILLTKMIRIPSTISTFLVEPLFMILLEELHNRITDAGSYFPEDLYGPIYQFYRDMDEFVNRRQIDSDRQNMLIRSFLWSLGIEKLKPEYISALVNYEIEYERNVGDVSDPILPYAYILTHPDELARELNLHRLEARAIVREIYLRRWEMRDIFWHYAQNKDDVELCFKQLI